MYSFLDISFSVQKGTLKYSVCIIIVRMSSDCTILSSDEVYFKHLQQSPKSEINIDQSNDLTHIRSSI